MPFESGLGAVLLLVGRLLFGGLLLFQGFNHFTNADTMTGYARSKGVLVAGFGVIASGVMLVLGGLGIVLGAYPIVAAGMLATFFVVTTPVMHDFWAVPEEEQQSEMIDFLKNAELLGASLVFLALGGETWGYALNVGI